MLTAINQCVRSLSQDLTTRTHSAYSVSPHGHQRPQGHRFSQTLTFSVTLTWFSKVPTLLRLTLNRCFQWHQNGNLYTADIRLLVAAHVLVLHQYADDCQIYIATPANETSSAVDRLTRCLNDVNAWLSASRLRLNPLSSQNTDLVARIEATGHCSHAGTGPGVISYCG